MTDDGSEETATATPGPLVLLGGAEWADDGLDDPVLRRGPVTIIPTAAAYENPARLVDRGLAWYAERAVAASVLPVYRRPEALAPAPLAEASTLVLTSGSGMHLRSVLHGAPLLAAVVAAWHAGTTLVASGQAATALCDPMVDGRGGAFTVGLGVVAGLTVVPRLDAWSEDKLHRTLRLAPSGFAVVGLTHGAGIVHEPGRGWRAIGAGEVRIWVDGEPAGLDAVPPVHR